jgi:hypothetical protein
MIMMEGFEGLNIVEQPSTCVDGGHPGVAATQHVVNLITARIWKITV